MCRGNSSQGIDSLEAGMAFGIDEAFERSFSREFGLSFHRIMKFGRRYVSVSEEKHVRFFLGAVCKHGVCDIIISNLLLVRLKQNNILFD